VTDRGADPESDALRQRLLAAVLELLERHHGIGSRAERAPRWLMARLETAFDRLLDAVRPHPDAALRAEDVSRAIVELGRDPERLAELADLVRIGETCFFRDAPQWLALRDRVVPRLMQRERVRALSVGCSTGEETWTLAMLLAEAARSGQSHGVVGMDRSEAALSTAREGIYPEQSARSVPAELAARYLERHENALAEPLVRVSDELRSQVRFVPRNATSGLPPGSYEIIICKNLLIYFSEHAGARLAAELVKSLSEGGVLLVARSEVARLRALGYRAETIAPGVSLFTG
jgi:chemotaxis protein methyltransferase CheR